MPDVKPPPPCDYASTSSLAASGGSPAGCTSSLDLIIDMEPCIANFPLTPNPLSSFPQHRPALTHYPGTQGPPLPLMARCNSSALLTNLGLRYCSSRHGPLGMGPDVGPTAGPYGHTSSNGSRPYRSMENLNWSTVADSGLCAFTAAPYRSVDNEFILHYTSTSHWCGTPPEGSVMGAHGLVPNAETLGLYPRHGMPRKDLPFFPQLLLPGGVDEWDARKGLREKLRLQSARSSAEPLKSLPLRPQVAPVTTPVDREGVYNMNSTAVGPRPVCTMRITSPEEIKQEVLRRLQLRRQNSSPNLALHSSSSSPREVRTSYTTDNIAGNRTELDHASHHCRPSIGRIHIPTFEEFKRMRQKEGEQSKQSTESSVTAVKADDGSFEETGKSCGKTPFSHLSDSQSNSSVGNREQQGDSEEMDVEMSKDERTESNGDAWPAVTFSESSPGNPSSSTTDPTSIRSTLSPIRTGPSPRSPLQSLANSTKEKACAAWQEEGGSRQRRSSLELARTVPFPPSRENWERPSSCCPALILEGTDLTGYGAKISKMKDGLIGSALDLIKKRSVEGGKKRGKYLLIITSLNICKQGVRFPYWCIFSIHICYITFTSHI